MTIHAINTRRRLVLTDADELLPITNFFAVGGQQVQDPALAIIAVAGRDDTWFTIDLREFEHAPVN
ncbi:hypothetical protein [Mesorhizobium sp.]|uniref:hypothetical protein n=1 Tax=Mesorhizobium sp. TaxID=1871066 RepID=UPI000FE89B8E|nr:hypothetical protein [Mesorhizobium sp.]RWI35398.1 MAG: hypothetical protein EOR14_28250 [Mesorhizobium sp.]RWJ66433.1 MAG: hypothetical protein EOR34_28885 [Mesorhizobium sp.]